MIRLLHFVDGLAHRFIWMAQAMIVGSLAIVAYYSMDREPPFEVLSVHPAFALPGEYVTIVASVSRDTKRNCSADFSRYLFDASRTRFDLGTQSASAEMIRSMEDRDPGTLRISFLVPKTAAPGFAWVETAIKYSCNKVHNIWPIEVTTRMPFTILRP